MRIFHDAGMKLLALGLAAILWLTVSAQRLEQVSVRTFDVPVAMVGIPRDLIITRADPSTVSVRLRGRLSTLRELSSQNLEATINLSDAKDGSATLPVSAPSFNLPEEIEVLSISPSRLNFRLEPRRQKRVRIRPYFVGELPPGYGFNPDDVSVDPESALVSGPASLISDAAEVATERIILSGRAEPFRQRVMLVSDSPLIRVVEPLNAVVSVTIQSSAGSQPAAETEEVASSPKPDDRRTPAARRETKTP